jgi:hypothetical protein
MKLEIDWPTIPEKYHEQVKQAEVLFRQQVSLLDDFELECLWHGFQNSPGVIGVHTTATIDNGEPRVSIPLRFDLNDRPLTRTVEQEMRRFYSSLREELRNASHRFRKRLSEMQVAEGSV